MFERARSPQVPPTSARARLERDVDRAGFYPSLVLDVIDDGLDGEPVVDHLIHQETHIDKSDVHRNVTVLVLGEKTMQILMIDDADVDETGRYPVAQITAESVLVSRITGVIVGYAHADPATFRRGDRIHEISVTIGWSGGKRVDTEPATCPDPDCTVDHGHVGTLAAEDLMLRINEAADGAEAVDRARTFAKALRRARLRLQDQP